jgi:sulfur-oxidizing protein SoxX
MEQLSRVVIVAVSSLAILGAGCAYSPAFDFPIEEGSIEAGRQAFIGQGCNRCHSVAGVRLPEPAGAASPLFELGGETSRVKAYSELVTSIINPDHRISERYREQVLRQALPPEESPMTTTHIDTMTVRQLIDIVAFLDSRYVLVDNYESAL